jgi:hypothetical protein
MTNNKKIQPKLFLTSAVATVCILAASGSGSAATIGGSAPLANANLTSVQRGVSTLTTTNVSPASSKSNSTWHGATYKTWTQRWWQWFDSIPLGVSPQKDTTGIQCGINQGGLVWFIGGPLGSSFSVSCTIPKGKAILAPIIDVNNDYPCPVPNFEPATGQSLENFLTTGSNEFWGATQYIDGTSVHTSELDGKPLDDLRITTDLFSFTGAASLAPQFDSCVTGSPQVGVSDGYFLFIEPLSVGHHTLHIHSESSVWGISDGTYNLNITQ